MKFKVNLNFRKFLVPKEEEDSGYYNPFDYRRRSKIDVRSDDEPFEQMLTIYHEVTHLVFDLFTQYEMDNRRSKIVKRSPKLRNDWRVYNEKSEKKRKDELSKEEIICAKIEEAVKNVLMKELPKRFAKQMFTNKKKVRIIKKRRKKHC